MALGERRVLEPTDVQPATPPAAVPRRVPWVSASILALSVLTALIDYLTQGQILDLGKLHPDAVRSGEWYRIFSNHFVHADFIHLIFNMSVVWTLGFSFERHIGSARFLCVSIVSAMGASTFVLALSPHATVGASGMILGWAGAMLPIATAVGRRALGLWLVQIAIISLLPFVSWQGHLGGFLFGLACGVFLKLGLFKVAAPFLIAASVAAAVAAGLARSST
jgi:rhomboid protease GluP